MVRPFPLGLLRALSALLEDLPDERMR
jgi:hypothetical protein